MTEPDVDWDVLAFRQWAAQRWPARAKFIRDGELDFDYFADAFRAGSAASAERIKELEARVAEQDRHNDVGAGMVIAAAIIVRVWGQTVEAEEILNAAGIVSFDDLRKCKVDAYDVWPLRPVLRSILGRPAPLGLAKYCGVA